jgi:hypothetical protein
MFGRKTAAGDDRTDRHPVEQVLAFLGAGGWADAEAIEGLESYCAHDHQRQPILAARRGHGPLGTIFYAGTCAGCHRLLTRVELPAPTPRAPVPIALAPASIKTPATPVKPTTPMFRAERRRAERAARSKRRRV